MQTHKTKKRAKKTLQTKTECRPILVIIIDTSSSIDELKKRMKPADQKELEELMAMFTVIWCPLRQSTGGEIRG